MKKFVKKLKRCYDLIPAWVELIRIKNSIWNKKYEEAFFRLKNVKSTKLLKYYEYYLLHAKVCRNLNEQYDLSNQYFLKAIEYIEMEKKILNENEKKYLTSYCLYSCYINCDFMNKKDQGQKFRKESDEYYFDMNKVSKDIQEDFPMPWHVDYCDYKGLPRPKGTENYQKPEDHPIQ